VSNKTRYSGIALGYHQRCALAVLLAGEKAIPFHWKQRSNWLKFYKMSWKNFLKRLSASGIEYQEDEKGRVSLIGFRAQALKAVFELQIQQVLGEDMKFSKKE
jgi:hypothetical protein